MDSSVSNISPREWLHIGWAFAHCHIVGPHDATESYNGSKQRKGSAIKGHIGPLGNFAVLIMNFPLSVIRLLHDHLSLHIIILDNTTDTITCAKTDKEYIRKVPLLLPQKLVHSN